MKSARHGSYMGNRGTLSEQTRLMFSELALLLKEYWRRMKQSFLLSLPTRDPTCFEHSGQLLSTFSRLHPLQITRRRSHCQIDLAFLLLERRYAFFLERYFVSEVESGEVRKILNMTNKSQTSSV